MEIPCISDKIRYYKNMAFIFEKFEFLGGRFEPKVSLRSNGAIGLSQGALVRFNLLNSEWHAELYYDKVEKVIAIKPIATAGSSTTKIVVKTLFSKDGRKSYSSFLSGKSFLEYYEIPFAKTRSYSAEWDEELKMILVKLSGSEARPEEEGQ